jgi:exosortase A
MSVDRRPVAAAAMQGHDISYWVAGLCLGLGAFLLGLLFRREVLGAVEVWLGSTAYNHCFLIIPVAAYMVWDRRATLTDLRPSPEPRILPAVAVLSLFWLVTVGIDILEARQFVAVAIFQAVAIGILGWRLYRALLAPFLYLFLLVPSGGFLVPWLQDFTAHFAVIGLQLAGVPVYADGTIIESPAGTFVVAEACAGLRFLVASLAFGIFYAVLMYRSPARRMIFVALSLIVPIIANWFRAFGIVYLANLTGSAKAVMADHIIYGWGFFTAVTILLILIGNTFSDGGRRRAAVTSPQSGEPRPAPNWKIAVVTALGIVFAAAGPGYAAFVENNVSGTILADAPPPNVAAPWRAIVDPGSSDWKPVVFGADKEFLRTFENGKERVFFYLALYRRSGTANNLVRAQNRIADEHRWQRTAGQTTRIALDGKEPTVAVTDIRGQSGHLEVFHFYVVDGKIVPGALAAKLYQTRDFFFGGNKVAAFVAIATDAGDGSQLPHRTVERFLNALAPMPDYLRNLGVAR